MSVDGGNEIKPIKDNCIKIHYLKLKKHQMLFKNRFCHPEEKKARGNKRRRRGGRKRTRRGGERG